MVYLENKIPHQYSNVIDSKVSNKDIHKIQRFPSSTPSKRQNCGINTSKENVGYAKSKIIQGSQGNSGLTFEGWDQNYHRISPKTFECSSRLGIVKQFHSLERIISYQIFQRVCEIRVFSEIDLFAFRLSHHVPTYFASKSDSQSYALDAFQYK